MAFEAQPKHVEFKVAWVLLLALVVLSLSVPASVGGSTASRASSKRVDALLVGRVESHLLRALKRNMGSQLRLLRDVRLSSKIDLVIMDGDHASPAQLDGLGAGVNGSTQAATEQSGDSELLLLRAVRTARWVLVLESDKSDRARGLSRLTGFDSGEGGDQAYLFRRSTTLDGVPQVRILTESLQVYKRLRGRARARAVRRRTAQVVRVIRNALAETPELPTRFESRAGETRPQLPLELLKAQWHIGPEIKAFSPITDGGTQTPTITVNYYYDAYLARESGSQENPGGKYQVISASIDGSFNPKSSNEKFIADRNATTTWPFYETFPVGKGYWTGAVEPIWKSVTGDVSLVKTDPATPNDETKYTTGTSYEFGAELSSEGPKGNAKVTVSNTKEYTVKDWVVRNKSAGNDASWRFSARNPCDVRAWPPPENGRSCFDFGGRPLDPNELSKGAMDFHLSAIWRTKRPIKGWAQFDSGFTALLVATECGDKDATYVAPACLSYAATPRTRAVGIATRIDLSSVMPVPVEKVSFQPKNANARSWPYGQSVAVVAGTTVTGKVKLATPAPWDVTIVVSKKEKDGRDLDPNDNVILNKDSFQIKKGTTEGTFTLDTSANSLSSDGLKTVPIGVFYDGFTRTQLTVCASTQAPPCRGSRH